jgi:hypothetical protein
MRKIKFLFLSAVVFASCNNNGTEGKEAAKDSTKKDSTATAAAVNYPYTIEHPDNWDIGSKQNTVIALSALKAFNSGNIAESVTYFGDSVKVEFDGMDKKLSNDSLKAIFTKWRNGYKSIDVKMQDWESVISKDKSEEWVTLWYRQKWEDTKGKADSADYIDDLKLKNGKIIQLDEYTRKLH